ncbi:MAG: HAMP domain-containing protein, partial [Candidatus Competibacteraceae bacterium]|nr:HAMP domain-containing protein [Candidatus Competibacteraceae bacterium]
MNKYSHLTQNWLPVLSLLALLLGLLLMSNATENSAHFGEMYSWLLLLSALGLLLLSALIGYSLYQLLNRFRRREPGARLSVRLVVFFVAISAIPLGVVYYFSLQFLQRGIDSWFNVEVENALTDALELSRASLTLRMREVLKQTERMADELTDVPESNLALRLGELLDFSESSELTLFGNSGRIVATANFDSSVILPSQPPEIVLLQVRQGHSYISLDPIRDVGFHIRALVQVPQSNPDHEPMLLQALHPVPERLGRLAESVQRAFDRYRELVFLRTPLKTSFILTLSLVLLFGILAALWSALRAARQLVAPIRDLAQGTRAVAAGKYDQQLPAGRNDELGFLVDSFNQMMRNLAQARDQAEHSQQIVEQQRAYLEVVLTRLSSGVITLDHDGLLYTYNAAAEQILGVRLDADTEQVSHLHSFFDAIRPHLSTPGDWRQEITLFSSSGRQVLMCRGSSLPDTVGLQGGHVIVFDDITNLVQVQRDAAWGEVARRLAHEIKNPLTPIQLAAERIRHKYLKILEPEQA